MQISHYEMQVWNRCEMTWDEEERKEFEFSEEKKDTSLEWEASTSDFFFFSANARSSSYS
jgi:hypothetical protein